MQNKISELGQLDSNIVNTYLDAYHQADKKYIFVTQKYHESGAKDLYYLKHVRSTFSDNEIGQVCYMLLNKIAHLHDFDIIYKYLSPRHVAITSGFQIDAPIDLHLKDITMIQLLDLLKDIPREEKTCGLHATFFAPEVV